MQTQDKKEDLFNRKKIRRPWWKHPIAAYSLTVPIVASGVGVALIGEYLLAPYYFSSVSVLVAILCISLLWGVRPGLLATILSCIALLYLYLLPHGSVGWEAVLQIFPLAVASLGMVAIIGQRETARQRALQAERLAQLHADNLGRTNQELRQANQLKDLFVSVASHELKTPITTIRGQAQLALRRIDKAASSPSHDNNLREAFAKVDEQTKRVTTLLDELLDLTSLRSGKHVLEKKPCNLNDICSGIVEEQRMISRRVIDLDLPTSPVILQANPIRLGQVVTNLVNNALKYSSVESVASVKVTRSENMVCLSVRDAGKGILPEQLTHIFQPFYRTSEARASTVGGTGLGLAICKDIIEQHHGRIWCESQLDAGSTFFVELPL